MEVREINDWDAELIGYDKPLLPDGKFEAVLVCHETAFFSRVPKSFYVFELYLWKKVAGTSVWRYFEPTAQPNFGLLDFPEFSRHSIMSKLNWRVMYERYKIYS